MNVSYIFGLNDFVGDAKIVLSWLMNDIEEFGNSKKEEQDSNS